MPGALDVLAATPKQLAHLVAELNDVQLDAAPPGEWSARIILAHLRDAEMFVMRVRVERMLAEDDPSFPDWDEHEWFASRSRTREGKTQLLGDFALQRQASLNLMAGMEPSAWERPGRHEDGTPYTIRSWLETRWATHDTVHLAQLEGLLGETLDDVLRRRFHPDS